MFLFLHQFSETLLEELQSVYILDQRVDLFVFHEFFQEVVDGRHVRPEVRDELFVE